MNTKQPTINNLPYTSSAWAEYILIWHLWNIKTKIGCGCDISKMLLRCMNVEQIRRALPPPKSLDDRIRDTTMSCCRHSTYFETVAVVDLTIKPSFCQSFGNCLYKVFSRQTPTIIKLKKWTPFVTSYCMVGKHSWVWTKCVSRATYIYTNALSVRIRFGSL